MNRKEFILKTIAIGILTVLISLSNAQEVSYEVSTVARIVGDTPDEILEQLNAKDLKLEHVTYYTEESIIEGLSYNSRASEIAHILKNQFLEENNILLNTNFWPSSSEWKRNELLILEAQSTAPEYACLHWNCRTPIDFDWNLENVKPLILFDSDFSGLYVPKAHDKSESFVGRFSQDSVMIATTAIPDREFVKAFVCNLARYSTYHSIPAKDKWSVGEIYRFSRNSYYWHSSKPSGLALISYELYGLPYLKVSVPHAALDDKTFEYCERYYRGDFSYGEGVTSG